jgi:hypothetical protein
LRPVVFGSHFFRLHLFCTCVQFFSILLLLASNEVCAEKKTRSRKAAATEGKGSGSPAPVRQDFSLQFQASSIENLPVTAAE